MKSFYLISGLGADERVFKNIDFGKNITKYVFWIKPRKNEELSEYCKRLSEQISNSDETVFIGVSFGGIVAIELSKIVPTKKVIIISSIKSKDEIPFLYRLIRVIGVIRIIPGFIFKIYMPFLTYLFGITSPKDKQLLKDFIKSTDTTFIKWAIRSILKWTNDQTSNKVVHLHGDKDKLFPIRTILKPIIIKDGGHFMILDKSEEISIKLNEILKM
ncbi:alpha/beta hydrolase [Leptospira santarosai]|uniref:alpha/beta hydrolase n=1 Tax=Leptospira santarosai TaxID=28183 RepID=UPI000248A580|nr:alpha/beta hydrolase [Leptospira santarosai]EMM77726.1 hypothetical protein LEP1GSC040_0171 [Leptospira santarosai str. 2000030832]MDI7187719.1 alpha/beta hydrolase [Leptospira santarosai]MDI7190929.1 alpha/beta hydrolase [Leptospira santarosai]MDI7208417.1 alpha/beta hydrolase [Leptospira santarosai]MDI7211795.1 alpha/beta hydrolase [Leptospira santarosai]